MNSKTVYAFICFLCCLSSSGQVYITPYIPDDFYNSSPQGAQTLELVLSKILSDNGITPLMGESRFIITGNYAIESKTITTGYPVQVAMVLNVTLFVGDGVAGVKYATNNFRVKGVGQTEEQTIHKAILNLKRQNDKISNLINIGKKRILAYYEENKSSILSEISLCIANNNYDEALYKLNLIPMECSYYCDIQHQIIDVYQQLTDYNALCAFNEAKSVWATNQNENGAVQALEICNKIEPGASCYPEVESFIHHIDNTIRINNERAYQTFQKQLQRQHEIEMLKIEADRESNRLQANVEKTRIREQERTKRNRDNRSAAIASRTIGAYERLESQRISAARAIAITYAKNNRRILVYNTSWRN